MIVNLTTDEQKRRDILIMTLAYFRGFDMTRTQLSNLVASWMSLKEVKRLITQLIREGIVQENKYYSSEADVRLADGKLFYGVSILLRPEYVEVKKQLRGLFRTKYRSAKLSPAVSQVIGILHPHDIDSGGSFSGYGFGYRVNFCAELAAVFADEAYAHIWSHVRTDDICGAMGIYLGDRLLNDEPIPWDYVRQLIAQLISEVAPKARRRGDDYDLLEHKLDYFDFLGTGRVPKDLKQMSADLFSLSIGAITMLYEGEYALAYKFFTKAMSAHNRYHDDSHYKGVFDDLFMNYYFVMAMLLTGTDTARNKITTMMKKDSRLRMVNALFLTDILNQYFVDKQEVRVDQYDLSYCFEGNTGKWSERWVVWMALKKLGLWNDKYKAPTLTTHAPRAAWLRKELSASGVIAANDEVNNLYGGSPIFSRLKIKTIWEMRLEELLASVAPAPTTDDATPAEERTHQLIYILEYNSIQPVLKKRLKNGSWSSGRRLNVTEFKGLDTSEFQDIDREFASHVDSWAYSIDLKKHIRYLVGCDHVYKSMGNYMHPEPVSVSEEKPFLIINRAKDGTFSIDSNIKKGMESIGTGRYLSVNDKKTQYTIVRLSTFEQRIYEEIMRQKNYPAEAEPLLMKLISALGGKTEIHSNMVEELDDIEKIDGNATIIIRCKPQDYAAYDITVAVRPWGDLQFVPGKGNVTTIAEKDGKKAQVVRDMRAERRNMKTIGEEIASLDGVDDLDTWMPTASNDTLSLKLSDFLEFLDWSKDQTDICQLEWPENTRVKYHPQVSAGGAHISFKSKGGWFDVEGDVQIDDDQVISLQQLLDLMHTAGRSKYIKIGKDEYITLSRDLSKILKRLDTVTTEQRSHLQMAPTGAALLGDLIGEDDDRGIFDHKALDQLLSRVREAQQQEPQVPATLGATLRDYQVEGFEWMSKLTAWGAGACLADDMGLGKTLQTIALLLEQVDHGASLVVAPASVVPNWRSELQRFAPSLRVTVLNEATDRQAAIDGAQAGDIIVTTYALLNTEQDALTAKAWNVVCLDEAHTIKNPATKMSKAAMRLQADRKVILTGTPIQNHLSELWNLFQFINPGLLGSAEQFSRKFIGPIENDHNKDRQSQLRRLITPFLLRRTKNEVIEELPEKNEIQVPVELSADEMTMYEVYRRKAEQAVLADKNVKVSTLAEITRLRQMACSCALVDKKWRKESSKVEAFIDLAESLNDSGNRALVFSQFTSFFAEVRRAMDRAKLPYLYLDGATPMGQRAKLVEDFQKGTCPFFLISLKAGGLGLNLTGANYVVHLDPWWNPAIEQQATDRAYRIGQQQDVTVYHLISQHTIEEKIVRLHKTKRDLADSLLEGADMAHALTQEELLSLLQDN